jgi:hypothetical protein
MTEPLRTIGGDPVQPGVDLAGLAMRTLGLGAALGSALQFVVLWGTRTLQHNTLPTDQPEVGGLFYFVVFGTMASMAVGGGTSWALLAPVGSPWRRAGLSAIAAFAALVAGAFAVPVDANLGPWALLGVAALLGLVALWAGRRVSAWYRTQG